MRHQIAARDGKAALTGIEVTPRVPAQVGEYLCDNDQALTFQAVPVRCPYCRRALSMLTPTGRRRAGRLSRIAKILRPAPDGRRSVVVAQVVPPHLHVLSCSRCNERFTVPANRSRWPRRLSDVPS